MLAVTAFLVQFAAAQSQQNSLAELLPETTVFAVFAQPGTASTEVFDEFVADLDVDEAMQTLRKLGVVLGSAADEMFDLGSELGGGLSGSGGLDVAIDELTADCPALGDALAELEPERFASRVAAGISLSRFTMMPTPVVAVRPEDDVLGLQLFEALTSCYDSGVAMSEGATPLYVLGDGGDFPMVVAWADDTLLAASDPDVVRGMVRRAQGGSEPSLLTTRVGSLSAALTGRGLAATLDLAAIADVLDALAPMLGNEPDQARLIQRVLASMRVVNGVAVGVSYDAAGLRIDSVVTVDQAAAAASGELALLDLLNCVGCVSAEPTLIPAGPASLSRSSFSVQALAAWLDTWLADLGPLFGEELTLAGVVQEYLGVDVDALLLGWLGSTWHSAQLDVYGTDVAAWLQGPGTITVVPVSSETAARDGLALWGEAFGSADGALAELLDELAVGDDLDLASTISIRPMTYRGIAYQRLRTPFSGDYGLAVFAGQLVSTQPASAMEAAIDVHLGGPNVLDDPSFGSLVAAQPAAPAGYQIIDLPRYLGGVARITDLAANPVASAMLVAVQAAVMESNDEADATEGEASGVDPADVPTFDELIGLADLVTRALELLADRTGIAISSAENIDGVHWSTLRVPLR